MDKEEEPGLQHSLLSLDDATLLSLLASTGLTVEDWLRCARVCRRLRVLVCHSASSLWQAAYVSAFGHPPTLPRGLSYLQLFRDRCETDRMHTYFLGMVVGSKQRPRPYPPRRWLDAAREERLSRRIARYRLQSSVATAERALQELAATIARERATQRRLVSELSTAQRARAAAVANVQWSLSAVRLYHNHVVAQATALSPEARSQELAQALAVSRLEESKAARSMRATRARLRDASRQLAALQG